MATLVLTTVGSLAGPIGGLIGAAIGNQLDRALLAPKGRRGPRLGDLSVQTSSYGSAIPKLFGTMRVAGTVIWATDLREDTHHAGGGKGAGSSTSYSYSASFAVALSARPIRSIGRIWADGKLLRGAAGDWKTETGFRLHLGGEDQAVDPLIAAAEGIGMTPAHRGIAYAVFEGLELADFGNRVPSLTFEVVADAGDVPVFGIAREISGGAIEGNGGPNVGGYAASGDSARGAIDALTAACPMFLRDDGAILRINSGGTMAIDPVMLGAAEGTKQEPALVRERKPAGELPDEVSIAYYEPKRDYQAGLQRARRDGIGRRAERIDLPVAIAADTARLLAEQALGRAWTEREEARVAVPWRLIEARAGYGVTIGDGGSWRVAEWSIEHMAVRLRLRREGNVSASAPGASQGRATLEGDQPGGATRLTLLDLPGFGDSAADVPRVFVAAAGTEPGWRRATVSVSLDGGGSWRQIGQTAAPAIIGTSVTALGTGSAALFDRANACVVELLHDEMALQGCDADALIAGSGLAIIGDEIIQFGAAEQIGERRWRIGTLLRGRRGTEWAIGSHAVGERFVLIEARSLRAIDVPLSAIGSELRVSAAGPGDQGTAAIASMSMVGRAVRPPAPVDFAAERRGDGTIRFRWVRRSRLGFAWIDGADAPLAEDVERYRLEIRASGAQARMVEIGVPLFDYDPAMQTADGVGNGAVIDAAVTQFGTRAPSLPAATLTLRL